MSYDKKLNDKSLILNNYLVKELKMTNEQKTLMVALMGVVMAFGVSHHTYKLTFKKFHDLIEFGVFWITDGLPKQNQEVIENEYATLYNVNLTQDEVTKALILSHNVYYNTDYEYD